MRQAIKRAKPNGAAPRAPADELPELISIPIVDINEPKLPAREQMDADEMRELQESIRDIGLLSPIVVVKRAKRYEVVAGHRRLLAARGLGWELIRAFVYPEGWRNQTAAMLHENIIRENLNPAQEAVFFAQLIEARKLDEQGLMRLVKRSANYIGDRLSLLRGDELVFDKLRAGIINFSVARLINRVGDDAMRHYFLEQAVRSGTNARVVEQWIHDWQASQVPGGNTQPVPLPPSQAEAPAPDKICCFLCGGDKDPYNLITVLIHKFELAEIRRLLDVREK